MTIQKTVYNSRLRPADSYTVECGGLKARFRWNEQHKVGEWIMKVWKDQEDGFFNTHSPAYVYYNIDWDCDHVLYCKYECV